VAGALRADVADFPLVSLVSDFTMSGTGYLYSLTATGDVMQSTDGGLTWTSSVAFDRPGVVELAPGRYEARIVAQVWSFAPNEIRVPAGSTVTFVVTSKDVVHGLLIHGANVNVMVLPGQVARATGRFDKPGEYPFLCHEYCGIAHHTMWGKVIVEARR